MIREVRFYDAVDDALLQFAVIAALAVIPHHGIHAHGPEAEGLRPRLLPQFPGGGLVHALPRFPMSPGDLQSSPLPMPAKHPAGL